MSVGCQKILFNLFDTSGDGEDEEFASACRMADSVLLCYKASDLQSLQSAAGKWFSLVRRFSLNSPVVLVGCKGDAKEFSANTILESEEMVKPVNAVMHVETSAATSSKSVKVAFQVAALACFTHQPSEQENHKKCQLQNVTYSAPSQLTVKLEVKHEEVRASENIYSNLPPIASAEHCNPWIDIPARNISSAVPLSVDTKATKQKNKNKIPRKEKKEKCVTILCQRLNKNKVLEKINVEVSLEVFEALQKNNPDILISQQPKEKEQPHSADFYLEKSVQEVKSALQCLRIWRAGSRDRLGERQTTCL